MALIPHISSVEERWEAATVMGGHVGRRSLTQNTFGMAYAVNSCLVGSPSCYWIYAARRALYEPQMAHAA